MKGTTGGLLEDYSQADFTRRLHLFLEYPDLRTEFMQIDRKASATGQHAAKGSDTQKTRRDCLWPRFLLLPGLQKRYCR